MRRWVSVVLLLLLPLQLSWAAAAVYCQHERGPGTVAHFGHHEHEHAPSADASAASEPDQDDGHALPLVDHDCAYCQLGSTHAMHVSFALGDMSLVQGYASDPAVSKPCVMPSGLDRPNWPAA